MCCKTLAKRASHSFLILHSCVIACALAGEGEPKRHALLVGVSEIPEQNCQLASPRYDVERVREHLEARGYSSRVLLDGDATESAVVQEISGIVEKIEPNDTFLFYFAGFGGTVADQSGEEADGLDETLQLHDGVIKDDELWQLLSQADQSCNLILLLDASHAGGFWDAGSPTHAKIPTTILFLAACQEQELAREQQFGGLFTSALLDAVTKETASGRLLQSIADDLARSEQRVEIVRRGSATELLGQISLRSSD